MDFSVPVGFIKRSDFGKDFLFGSSTSAFQIEGGPERDGRKPSIYDTMAEREGLYNEYGSDGVNHREKYKEDVKFMKDIGFNAYRFSISWCRVMPNGKRSEEGIKFYKDLLKELEAAGIEPLVTLLHFDPPQYLEDEYHTFLSPRIVDDFCKYAELCFQEFGEYVKYWTTINEPWLVSVEGYIGGSIPPGYKTDKDHGKLKTEALQSREDNTNSNDPSSLSPPVKPGCTHPPSGGSGNGECLPPPEKMPFLAAHHQILAHAKAARLYKDKYQSKAPNGSGKIGLNIVAQWFEPFDDTKEHKDAVERAWDFMVGWFMEPLYKGDYPALMRKHVNPGLLPYFTADEKEMVRGSYDFISLNYYTSMYASHLPYSARGDYLLDRQVDFHQEKDGVPIGEVKANSSWLIGYPKGILEVLRRLKKKYNDPEIIISENGIDDKDDGSMTHWQSFYDEKRVLYLHDHLSYIKDAINKDGVKVTGHCVWSLLDNLELSVGFKSRFGVIYVDYDENAKRIPKYSASWYKHFLKGGSDKSLESLEAKVEELEKQIKTLTGKPGGTQGGWYQTLSNK